jgi:D-lactate dehydrogenase (cytochrome)
MLLMEFHGSDASVAEQADTVQAIAKEHGGADFEWARTPEERTRLWAARHQSYFAALQTRPGCRCQSTDTCVPISRLAESINESVAEADASGIPYWIVGHVGDGNFHCSLVCDVDNAEEMARGEDFMHRLVERAQAMGGTCTGEHGIGQGKQKYLKAELGPEAIDAMRALKQALDPQNIFNPGKIVPAV